MKYLLALLTLIFFTSCNQEAKVEDVQIANLSIVSGEVIDFSYTPIDSAKETTIILKNNGDFKMTNIKTSKFENGSAFRFKGDDFPGIGGDCLDFLDIDSECKIVVEFSPTTSGLWTTEFYVSYLNGVEINKKNITIKGVSGQKPKIEFDNTIDPNFGILESFQSKSKTVRITNTGKLPIKNMSVSLNKIGDIDYKGGTFPGIGGTCGSTLEFGASCTMVFEFAPLTDKSHSTTININYDDFSGVVTNSKSLVGQSLNIVANLVFVGVLSVDFGITVQTNPSKQILRIKNEGYAKASTISLNFTQSDFYISDNRCPAELDQAEQCEIEVSFNPSIFNSRLEKVSIDYNNSKTMKTSPTIDLTGIGRSVAKLELEDLTNSGVTISNYNYGTIGNNDFKTTSFVLKNVGGIFANTIKYNALSAPFQIISNTCKASLVTSKTCQIDVAYLPTTTGNHNQNFVIDYNNGASNTQLILPLSGSADPIGVLNYSNLDRFKPEINYGLKATGTVSTKTITLKNTGSSTLSNITAPVLGTSMSYNGGFPGSGGTCPPAPFSLAPSASCDVVISYSPTFSESNNFQNYAFSYFDGSNNLAKEFKLSKSAAAPAKIIVTEDGSSELLQTNFGKTSVSNIKIKKITIQNTGGFSASNINYAFADSVYSFNEDFPTKGEKSELGDCPFPSNGLGPNSSCDIYIKFIPDDTGAKNFDFTISYFNEITNTSTVHQLIGEGSNIAQLDISPKENFSGVFQFPDAAYPGGSSTQTFTISNIGQASATSLNFSNIFSPFSIDPSTTCGTTLGASANCDLVLKFTPSYIGQNSTIPQINYNNGQENVSTNIIIVSQGVNPGLLNIAFPVTPPYDFGESITNQEKTLSISLTNKGGFPVTFNSILSSNALFNIKSDNCTAAQLMPYSACSLILKVDPTNADIGNIIFSTFTANYYNGVENIDFGFDTQAEIIPPKSIHADWVTINAFGKTTNSANTTLENPKVELKWNSMTPTQAYPVLGYNVYRKAPTDAVFDYNSPIATNIDPTIRSYTDTSVVEAKRYIYEVRPVLLGFPSKVEEEFATIEVVVPVSNMAFIHRRIANKIICEKILKSSIPDEFNRCLYNGLGNDEQGYFDIGSHLFYDRFELGTNGLATAAQLPKINYTQTSLSNKCVSTTFTLDGESISKRLPSRKELTIGSTWANGTVVEDVETGFIFEEKCNTNSSSIENNSNNSQCVSSFGIYNLIGNSWEIVSDRLIDAKGPTNDSQKLYVENKDMDLLNIVSLTTGNISSQECINYAIGHPMPKFGGVCPEGSALGSSSGIVNDKMFHPAFFSANFAIGLAGGNYEAITQPGQYTSAWVSPTYQAGGRCVAVIETKDKFPPEE